MRLCSGKVHVMALRTATAKKTFEDYLVNGLD